MPLNFPIGFQSFFLTCKMTITEKFQLMVVAIHWALLQQSYLLVSQDRDGDKCLGEQLGEFETNIEIKGATTRLELEYQQYQLGDSLKVIYTEGNTFIMALFETSWGGDQLEFVYDTYITGSTIKKKDVQLIFIIGQFNELVFKIAKILDNLRSNFLMPAILKKLQGPEKFLFKTIAQAIDDVVLEKGWERTTQKSLFEPKTLSITPQTDLLTLGVKYKFVESTNKDLSFRMYQEDTMQIKIDLLVNSHQYIFQVNEVDVLKNERFIAMMKKYVAGVLDLLKKSELLASY